jgi:hypothetical protein
LISVSEFASRAGVSRQAVYKAISSGRLNRKDGKIDETDALSAEYLSGSNPSIQRQLHDTSPKSKPQQQTNRAAIDAEKAKQQAIHWQLRNAKDRGALIDRELVAKAIEITDSEHTRLLADGSQTIAKVAYDLVRTDAAKEEIIEAVREEISGFLKSWKRQISRQLKMFYDE